MKSKVKKTYKKKTMSEGKKKGGCGCGCGG